MKDINKASHTKYLIKSQDSRLIYELLISAMESDSISIDHNGDVVVHGMTFDRLLANNSGNSRDKYVGKTVYMRFNPYEFTKAYKNKIDEAVTM